jgi:hypothetical protein
VAPAAVKVEVFKVVQFWTVESPPALVGSILTWLSTEEPRAKPDGTFTVNCTALVAGLGIGVLVVQTTSFVLLPPAQVNPALLVLTGALAKVKPAGNVSIKATVPDVAKPLCVVPGNCEALLTLTV